MEAIEQYVIDKVWKMRSEKGWSLQELADYMNVSKGFLANVESKKRVTHYNLKHINQLAKIFQCSPKDFLPDTPLD
ncbi:hypothetical protein EZS27_022770 [termite gut metagenome]|uniref:HTH cro/C1-type domain-containing protein n=2 Tax=termite gut metagenome TaxID=433724 RepID=A0A5J4R454_9ZZZZ